MKHVFQLYFIRTHYDLVAFKYTTKVVPVWLITKKKKKGIRKRGHIDRTMYVAYMYTKFVHRIK